MSFATGRAFDLSKEFSFGVWILGLKVQVGVSDRVLNLVVTANGCPWGVGVIRGSDESQHNSLWVYHKGFEARLQLHDRTSVGSFAQAQLSK